MQALRAGDAHHSRQQHARYGVRGGCGTLGVHARYGLGAFHRAHDHRRVLKEYNFLLVRRACKRIPDADKPGGWDVPDAGTVRVYDADCAGRAVWV